MKILIVSDTHRENYNYFRVVQKHRPDMVIHCGDAEGSEYALSQAADCPLQIVLGNNDFFSELPRELILDIGKYKAWVTHGHNYYVSMGYEHLAEEAKHRGVDIVMYGHTHRPVIAHDGALTILNPGSLSYPRQEGKKPSYIVMEIDRAGEAHYAIEWA